MFVTFEVESSFFLKRFFKSLYRNTWHSFNTFEELVDLTVSSKGSKKLSFCCTYDSIETEFEHVAESIRKRILELNVIQLVEKVFLTLFFQSVRKGRKDDMVNKIL